MASELSIQHDATGVTVYATIRRATDNQIWNTAGTPAFQAYQTANIADYDIALTEQGTASRCYVGTFPTGISTAGVYYVHYFERAGGSPAEGDLCVGYEIIQWSGSAVVSLNSRLAPTVEGRTLDVTATGEAGIDWANIGSPTTTVGLSGTTVKTATDVETDTADIQSRLPAALGANGNIKADVRDYNGTAGTFSGGRPEVNTSHAAGTAWGSGAITAGAIATGAITSAKFAAGAIDAAAIADAAIDAATFAANAITATVIADGAIDAAAIASDAITAAKIADGAIDAATFAAGAINAAAIADSAIDAATFAAGAINAAAIADGAIDRATFAADTGLQTVRSNTAQAGGASSITLDASASATTDFYKGCLVYLTGGTGAGQYRLVTAYNGTTKAATIAPAWATNPDNTSTFAVVPTGMVSLEAILGVAVSTSTAQLGVNVVNAAGTAWGSGAITAASIASGAITAAKFGAGAIDATAIADGAIDAATFAAGAITASAIAASAIGASELATDAIAAIADAVWDEATSGHTTSGTFGEQCKTDIDAILDDTGTSGVVVASIANNAITAAAIADNAIDAAAIATDAITAAKIAAGAIDAATFAADALAAIESECNDALIGQNLDHLVKSAVDTNFATTVHLNSVIGSLADNGTSATFDRTTDSLEAIRDRGDSAWITATAVTISSGGITTSSFAAGAIDAAALGNNAITAAKIATDAIGGDELAASAITKIQSGLSSLDAAGVRGAVGLASANLDTQLSSISTKIDTVDTVVDAILADTGTDGVAIADGSITAAKLGSNAITAAKIASDAITAAKIADNAITSAKIASGAIGASQVADGAIDAAALASDAITAIQSGLSTLTAAGVRTSVGLASANLDTQLSTIDTVVDAVLDDTGTAGVVVASASKTGYALAATGLDAITASDPGGVASTFPQMVVQLWRRFFRKTTKTATELKTYADNGSTVRTTQVVSDDSVTQTQGPAT